MKQFKQRVFTIISKATDGDLASAAFDWLIIAMILLSIVCIVLESFAVLAARFGTLFRRAELLTVVIFTVEYVLRIWTADLLYPNARHPKLKYIFSMMAIIDLLAILPFYIPFLSVDLRFLRMIRLLRLLRLLRVVKMGRYVDALQRILDVIQESASQLMMSVVICGFLMLFAAIIMYTAENPVQPDAFPNIIASLWWAICTLTTVGYGDIYPITAIGRFFASVISLIGIGVIAIPTGIIAAGFTEAISKKHSLDEPSAAPTEDTEAALIEAFRKLEHGEQVAVCKIVGIEPPAQKPEK